MLKDWPYYRDITITNTSGSDLNDYQINLTLDTSAITGMNSNLSDVRFTQGNQIIPHWIRNDGGGDPTFINSKTVTNTNSVTKSTSYKKFGDSSAYFNGTTGQYLSIPDSTDMKVYSTYGSTGYTIEFWVYLVGYPSVRSPLITKVPTSSTYSGIDISLNGYNLVLRATTSSMGWMIDSETPLSTGEWHHVVLMQQNTVATKIYIDGTCKFSVGAASWLDNSNPWLIGGYTNVASTNCYIDEVRFSSTLRYNINSNTLTVPTSAFTADSNTLLLLHMDNSSDSTFIDTTSKYETWVKVPSIPTTGSTIRMYYGNPNAISTSNGDTTFHLFDHFSGGSLDTNKWIPTTVNGTVSVSSSVVSNTITTGAAGNTSYMLSKTRFPVGYSLRCRVKNYHTSTTDGLPYEAVFVKDIDAEQLGLYASGTTSLPGVFAYAASVGGFRASSGGFVNYAFNIVELKRVSASQSFVDINGTPTSVTSNITLATTCAGISAHTAGATTGQIDTDWILVRKIVSTAPTTAIGSVVTNTQSTLSANKPFRANKGNNF